MAETSEKQALQTAIEALYQVFSVYPLPENMEGCPHCVDKADLLPLLSKPLRELEADDLDHYAFKATTTWGTEEDFKYFLPRILELLTFDSGLMVDPEIILGKLSYGNWRTWLASEQLALEKFLSALWEVILTTYSYPISINDGLAGIARAVHDISPYLASWQTKIQAVKLTTLRQLSAFLRWSVDELVKGRLTWFSQAQVTLLVNWLLKTEVTQSLERGFFEYSSNPQQAALAAELSEAVEHLKWIRIARG